MSRRMRIVNNGVRIVLVYTVKALRLLQTGTN